MTPDKLLMLLAGTAAQDGQLCPQLASDQARQAAERLLAAVGLTHALPQHALEAPPVPAIAATEPLRRFRGGRVGVDADPRLAHGQAADGGRARYQGWAS